MYRFVINGGSGKGRRPDKKKKKGEKSKAKGRRQFVCLKEVDPEGSIVSMSSARRKEKKKKRAPVKARKEKTEIAWNLRV